MEGFTPPRRTPKHAAMPCWSGALVHAWLKCSLTAMLQRALVTESQRLPVLQQLKKYSNQICQLGMKANLRMWLKRVSVIRAEC